MTETARAKKASAAPVQKKAVAQKGEATVTSPARKTPGTAARRLAVKPDEKPWTAKEVDEVRSELDADIFQDFNTWANAANGPREMNASFGECEANPTNPVTGPLAQQPYGTELGDELQAMGDPILRQAAMEGGATLTAPETVQLSWDTRLAPDVTRFAAAAVLPAILRAVARAMTGPP